MTKEELIKNQFPNDEFLQSAVSLIVDKCVADLERKLEQTEKDLADYQFNYPTINELEETNNELKGKLVLSDMVLADKTKRIKELEDKLTEKVTLESLDVVSARMEELAKVNADLTARVEKQNADILTLKGLAERQRLRIVALDEQTPWKDIKDKSELIGKLTKAKEIIREYMNLANLPLKPYSQTTISYPKEMVKRSEDLIAKAEAFLNSEVEK